MQSVVVFSNRLFPVSAGQIVSVTGLASGEAEVFELKLASARKIIDIDDIHLNFMVNFKTGEIVRNSRVNEVWGKAEISENLLGQKLNPLVKGKEFKIDINVYSNMFIVVINNSPFCTYELRKPLNEIQKTVVTGDVEKVYGVDHLSVDKKTLEVNENQVFHGIIPSTFDLVNLLVVTANVKDKSGNFNVNFRNSMESPILLQLVIEFDGENFKFR